ncbi:MAG: EamA family transporter [Pyrinomonadaceae bacterium]|nr:EamA family transporter [Sphingobacteriaceae bacterium]
MVQTGRIKYFLAAIAAAVIWGFFAIPLRHLKSYPSEQILHFRIVLSLVFTWTIILLFRRKHARQDVAYLKSLSSTNRKRLFLLTIAAAVLITGNWYTFIYAINNVSLKSAAFAYMVCPLLTAFGGFIILKEKISTVKIAGIGLAIISIVILASGSLIEVLWSVFIASLYALYLIIQRIIQEVDKLNMLGIQLILSTVIMFPFFIYHQYSIPNALDFWLNIALIAAVFTVIPLFLSLYALIGMASSTLGIMIYINPIIAFSVAFFYFHERVSKLQSAAYTLLFIAVLVFNWTFISEVFNKRRTSDK